MQMPDGTPEVPMNDEMAQFVAKLNNPNTAARESIEALFTYFKPDDVDTAKYVHIRQAAKNLAYMIDNCCPECPDRTAAMRHLSDCVATANASIARRGASYR